ncbi:MAG: hypothetical protein M3R27_05845 [Bacteroidota bacterium]|nr:hypothetical protein [Bacteroidota bacterium]
MADHINCTNNILTAEQLIAALITKTSGGDWALRTIEVTACAEDAIGCDLSHLTPFDVLKKCIGINECGKPAIRLAIGTDEAGS